jgi:molybdopterin converting factor small subunit
VIRVVLPAPLRSAGGLPGEIALDVAEPTQAALLDALEARFPVLRGTLRDYATRRRRAYVRFFACGRDLSHEAPDAPLPAAVANGVEPFIVIGAMSGG